MLSVYTPDILIGDKIIMNLFVSIRQYSDAPSYHSTMLASFVPDS